MNKFNKIGIAGAGGIGGYLIQYLYDFGAIRNQYPFLDCEISVFDNDVVDHKNLLHQNYTVDDLGKEKVAVIEARYPGMFKTVGKFMEEKDFKKFDVIFSCVDSMSFRKSLYEYGWSNPKKAYWIDGRCSSRIGAVFNSSVKKETLDRYINDSQDREGCLLKFEKEQNISHTTPIIVAGIMTQTFLNYTRQEKTSEHILRV